jgi:hypothetical protein
MQRIRKDGHAVGPEATDNLKNRESQIQEERNSDIPLPFMRMMMCHGCILH